MEEKYALISVFDKTGIVDFAKQIADLGYKIISTGGTAKYLQDKGVQIIPIQKITGNPESFDGRIKTISFQIESGILFDRSNSSHVKQAKELQIKPIDVVVCNLYPFEKEQIIENIDVGGPTMIRAAAKNFKDVVVVVDPTDYKRVANILEKMPFEFRQELAAKAFAHTSLYDSQIARYLEVELYPKEVTIPGRKVTDLRYGENPHQKAAFYLQPNTNSPLKNLKRLSGRELSLVNLTDINAGIATVRLFNKPAAVVIKHNNPAGIALGETAKVAIERAIKADAESAFGGIVVLNVPFDEDAAEVVTAFKDEKHGNIDIIAAPTVNNDALSRLANVRKSMGIYTFGKVKSQKSKVKVMDTKWVDGGFILQEADIEIEKSFSSWDVVTEKKPTQEQMEQMKIAWKFISRIKSNAVIVVDKALPMTRGIGTGQTSRVRATKIALEQAGSYAKGGILASDSFFPFPDSIEFAAKYGIAAVVQQGGSVNDQASIDAANKAGIAMIFTHHRAFWH